jgi:hypothetical protein
MKKLATLALAVVLVVSSGYSQKFALKLGGGLGILKGNDLTRGIQGQSDFLNKEYGFETGFAIPEQGREFGGELLFFPVPRFGIGLGVGSFQVFKESRISYAVGSLNATEWIKPTITVIPVTLNLHFNLPLASWFRVDLSAGAGYYQTTLKWEYRADFDLAGFKGNDVYSFSAEKGGFGYQAGLGLEFAFSPRFAVVLGVGGRSVTIGPFANGTWSETVGGDFESFGDGGSDHTFWAYDKQAHDRSYALIAFQAEPPYGSPAIGNAREAKLDLTGLTASIGVKVGFGRRP